MTYRAALYSLLMTAMVGCADPVLTPSEGALVGKWSIEVTPAADCVTQGVSASFLVTRVGQQLTGTFVPPDIGVLAAGYRGSLSGAMTSAGLLLAVEISTNDSHGSYNSYRGSSTLSFVDSEKSFSATGPSTGVSGFESLGGVTPSVSCTSSQHTLTARYFGK